MARALLEVAGEKGAMKKPDPHLDHKPRVTAEVGGDASEGEQVLNEGATVRYATEPPERRMP